MLNDLNGNAVSNGGDLVAKVTPAKRNHEELIEIKEKVVYPVQRSFVRRARRR
jgi:hypothetical protein